MWIFVSCVRVRGGSDLCRSSSSTVRHTSSQQQSREPRVKVNQQSVVSHARAAREGVQSSQISSKHQAQSTHTLHITAADHQLALVSNTKSFFRALIDESTMAKQLARIFGTEEVSVLNYLVVPLSYSCMLTPVPRTRLIARSILK
jgi:hypothetical protein